jgi:FkbH-like protein
VAVSAVELTLPQRVRAARGSLASALALARSIESGDSTALEPVRLSVLATFTAEPLRPHLIVEGAARRLRIQPHFMPFNQLEIQVLSDGSGLYASKPDVVLIAARVEELAPHLAGRFSSLTTTQVVAEIDEVAARLETLLGGIRQRTGAAILTWNFSRPYHLSAGIADPMLQPSQVSAIARLNEALSRVAAKFPDCYVVDHGAAVAEHGLSRVNDRRMWFRARMPFGIEGLTAAAAVTARYIAALSRPPRKCLVLDLDNTLWGGVLGEEGAGGIRMGADHPGTLYRAFQEYLIALRDRGVLLALASKNDRDEALQILSSHPDCLLRPEMFSAVEIGWGDKATSLRNIARDLSIGLDTLAFFDDSAVEREWVRGQLPEVAVIDVPGDPLEYIGALDRAELFDALSISEEDRSRAAMYHSERSRQRLQAAETSVEEFLSGLEIRVVIGGVDHQALPRVTQLIGKTNQFNTTTRRYRQTEIEKLIADGAIAIWARVSDKFGDSGVVGVAIAVSEGSNGAWRIDVLLLSCRVIGRGVESTLLSELARRVRLRGGKRLVGEFIPTARNEPAEEVFRDNGFSAVAEAPGLWEYDLEADGPRPSPFINLTLND